MKVVLATTFVCLYVAAVQSAVVKVYKTVHYSTVMHSAVQSGVGCKVDLFVGHLDKSAKDTYTSNTPHVKHDNTMSALRLQPGCCVTLFDLPNYRGASKRTCSTMNFAQLGAGWNDKVSSLKLEPACKVDLFEGHFDKSAKDTYTSNIPHVKRDNTMSALRLQPGCCVTLFDLPNYKGASKRTCSNLVFSQVMGAGWNDKVSSLKLESGHKGDEDNEKEEMEEGQLEDEEEQQSVDEEVDDDVQDEEDEEDLDDEKPPM